MADRPLPKAVFVGSLVVLVGASVYFFKGTDSAPPPPAPEPVAVSTPVAEPAPLSTEVPDEPPAFDPEKQPRTTYVADFTNGVPEGFVAGNIVATAEGLKLGDAPAGADGKRRGTLDSPDLPADFPLNSFVPLWKEKLADGTKVSVEMSLSVDGVTWGPWMPYVADAEDTEEISPTYPDGRPNPFYGYTAAMRTTFGEDLWGAFRYRFTLESANSSTPTLSSVRLYYQDSTMGEGKPGNMGTIAQLLQK